MRPLWPVLGLAAITIVAAYIAAVTAPVNPALSVFAGVIVGAVVTAIGTWIVAPSVERQARQETYREQAVAELAPMVLAAADTARSIAATPYELQTRVKLEELSGNAPTIEIHAFRSHDVQLVTLSQEWRLAVLSAQLSVGLLPVSTSEGEARITVRMRSVGASATAGGDPNSREHKIAAEALDALETLDNKSRELLTRVLKLSGARENLVEAWRSVPTGQDDLLGSATRAAIQEDVAQALVTSMALQDDLAEEVGERILLISKSDGDDDFTAQLNREMTDARANGFGIGPAASALPQVTQKRPAARVFDLMSSVLFRFSPARRRKIDLTSTQPPPEAEPDARLLGRVALQALASRDHQTFPLFGTIAGQTVKQMLGADAAQEGGQAGRGRSQA